MNFLDSDDDASRVREAYGDDTYWRLAEVKAKYDPENVFHHNKNIQPDKPDHLIRQATAARPTSAGSVHCMTSGYRLHRRG